MDFQPASQNGVEAPTELKSLQSNFGLIASSTSTYYGRPFVLKALSDAAMYKTEPVTFYSSFYNGVSTSTVTLGTGTFIDTISAPLFLNNLGTGTHQIYASWPGEGLYAGQSTQANPVPVVVAAGLPIGGDFNLLASPSSGSLVVGEGTATFTAILTTTTEVPGNIIFLNDHTQLGSVSLLFNQASISVDDLGTGTNKITAVWGGATINGNFYEGRSTFINYEILEGAVFPGYFRITNKSPETPVSEEGTISFTAGFLTQLNPPIASTQAITGKVTFSLYKDYTENNTPLISQYTEFNNNLATISFPNVYTTGTYFITAEWDGNQTSHPRYTKRTAISQFNIVERGTVPGITFGITPSPTAFGIETSFRAELSTSTTINGSINFYDTVFGQIGSAPLVNNVATFKTSSLNTGTYNVYARYPGSSATPKWFPIQSTSTSLSVASGLALPTPTFTVTNDNYQGTTNPYVIGETQTITASITTSTQLTGEITFYANNRPFSTGTWVNNLAVSTGTFTEPGTYTVFGLWRGRQIGASSYSDTRTAFQTITATSGYVLSTPIYVTAEQPTVYNEPMVFTATVSTSTIMGGSIGFFANGSNIGYSEFSTTTNKATLIGSIASTGSYIISAVWAGGTIDNGRLYQGKDAMATSTNVLLARTLGGDFVLTANTSSHVFSTSTVLTARLTTSTSINGTLPVQFIDREVKTRVTITPTTVDYEPNGLYRTLKFTAGNNLINIVPTPTQSLSTSTGDRLDVLFNNIHFNNVKSPELTFKFVGQKSVTLSGKTVLCPTIKIIDSRVNTNLNPLMSTVIDSGKSWVFPGTGETPTGSTFIGFNSYDGFRADSKLLNTISVFASNTSSSFIDTMEIIDLIDIYSNGVKVAVTGTDVTTVWAIWDKALFDEATATYVPTPSPGYYTYSYKNELILMPLRKLTIGGKTYYIIDTSGNLFDYTNSLNNTTLTLRCPRLDNMVATYNDIYYKLYQEAEQNYLEVWDTNLNKQYDNSLEWANQLVWNAEGPPYSSTQTSPPGVNVFKRWTGTYNTGTTRPYIFDRWTSLTTGTVRLQVDSRVTSTSTFVPVSDVILGNAYLVNNTATLTLNAGTLEVTDHTIQAVWGGNDSAPKYFGKVSNTATITIING